MKFNIACYPQSMLSSYITMSLVRPLRSRNHIIFCHLFVSLIASILASSQEEEGTPKNNRHGRHWERKRTWPLF